MGSHCSYSPFDHIGYKRKISTTKKYFIPNRKLALQLLRCFIIHVIYTIRTYSDTLCARLSIYYIYTRKMKITIGNSTIHIIVLFWRFGYTDRRFPEFFVSFQPFHRITARLAEY